MVQYNPERVRSATAFVDRSAVVARPCFLCQNNLPVEQLGISVLNRYRLLCNPYPIAPYHFTIAERQHCPQQIAGRIDHLLALSELLPRYAVFYNGAHCGASAPDHFHFQALPATFLPLCGRNWQKCMPLGEWQIVHSYILYGLCVADAKEKISIAFDCCCEAWGKLKGKEGKNPCLT